MYRLERTSGATGEFLSYRTCTIANVIDNLNRSYFLPAIQRPFVWEADQIIALFDSLMKSFPISSFLLWDVKGENRDQWDIYKFIENFRYGSTHNEPADRASDDLILVLDGQQRLTSLLIGLRGSYTIRRKHKRKGNPDAWERYVLYLDVMKDPLSDADESDLGVTYAFRFFSSPPQFSQNHLWIRVGEIMSFGAEEKLELYKDRLIDQLPDTLTKHQERTVRRNVDRLHRMIWLDESIAFYTETNQSYDRVLNIFIRANDGGTKLSKSDLLLSMITSQWSDFNAREEIFNFVDYLNNELGRPNDISKDFVMKAMLVISDLDVKFSVDNYTPANLSKIKGNWPNIKRAITATFKLINRFGIDSHSLTSTNALMPIVYYMSRTQLPLDGTTTDEGVNAQKIHRWVVAALINSVFGGTSDGAISKARSIIIDRLQFEKHFPAASLIDRMREINKVSHFAEENLDALLDMEFGNRKVFLALSLLYENNKWGQDDFHVDHIIPRSLCIPSKLRELGLSAERMKEIQSCIDRLGNLQLLIPRENIEKSNHTFTSWMAARDDRFLDAHLMPTDRTLWTVERLPEFVAAREELIRHKIASLELVSGTAAA